MSYYGLVNLQCGQMESSYNRHLSHRLPIYWYCHICAMEYRIPLIVGLLSIRIIRKLKIFSRPKFLIFDLVHVILRYWLRAMKINANHLWSLMVQILSDDNIVFKHAHFTWCILVLVRFCWCTKLLFIALVFAAV